MKEYEILKEIRRKVKKLRNGHDDKREETIADIEKTKKDLELHLYCLEKAFGREYIVFIEYYFFKGYTDDEIDREKKIKNNADLSILPDNLRTLKDNLRNFSEENDYLKECSESDTYWLDNLIAFKKNIKIFSEEINE